MDTKKLLNTFHKYVKKKPSHNTFFDFLKNTYIML